MGFNQPVRRLTTGRAGPDGRVVVVEEGAYSAAKQLLIAVTLELMGKSAGLISKGEKCGLNVIVLEGFKAKQPVVAGGGSTKMRAIFYPLTETQSPKAISTWTMSRYLAGSQSIALPWGFFQDCRICAEGEGKLAGVE